VTETNVVSDELRAGRPLRIAALVKQVPVAESLQLGSDLRLERTGQALEMNPYCRRAVTKAVQLAQASKGSSVVFTLGPPEAEDVLREAIAWGIDCGIHVCDSAFAGSDTLATARALAAALLESGPFDLILAGKYSIDGETGQVGPQLAELLNVPFASGVRNLTLDGEHLSLSLEHDDGWEDVEVDLPVLLTVAERLCEPCKVKPQDRALVPASSIRRLTAAELGAGPWGAPGSPTRVDSVRSHEHSRSQLRFDGSPDELVRKAVAWLKQRSLLPTEGAPEQVVRDPEGLDGTLEAERHSDAGYVVDENAPAIVVLAESGRASVTVELLGAAVNMAAATSRRIVVVGAHGNALLEDVEYLQSSGVSETLLFRDGLVAEDTAQAFVDWARVNRPWAVLVPSTDFGREVAGRAAAALGAGLIGDAVDVVVTNGILVGAKPALAGALIADVTCDSPIQLVSIRPGVLPTTPSRHWPLRPQRAQIARTPLLATERARVHVVSATRNDDVEILARADVVIGVGTGVAPDEYNQLEPLAEVLGAEFAATRKVTDNGWMPRARQVGITGRSISPRLYVAVGLSGKFNHMVGVQGAGAVLAINEDSSAPVFDHADLGLIGDWRQIVEGLADVCRLSLWTSEGV
jgi:electron transfer flavoprotein alpha subunit